ncbi:hypothetical protein [Ottowia sp.]|jgi:hypothetical protein|uniref:hypothetical protein n=1 Tax=Ottowia sp. TaxID=1898956 RepID=UPI0025E516A3|nr:hypothetical protein [Ottowia sp.]
MTVRQALEQAPTLVRLNQMLAESTARLAIVRPCLPAPLRPDVSAGPIEGNAWCLLVPHNAAAAKIRQLMPVLLGTLQAAGHPVETIRVKVQRAGP